MFVTAILLITLWAGYWISPDFNLWLTLSARQSVVDRFISDTSNLKSSGRPGLGQFEITQPFKNIEPIENWLLGQYTGYPRDKEVYFDYYKRGESGLGQAAFIVYAARGRINSIDGHIQQLKQLKPNCFFLLRGYAD